MFSSNATKTVQPFVMSSHLCFAGGHFSEHSVYTRCVCVAPPLTSGSGPDRFSSLQRKSVLTAFPILLIHQQQQRYNNTFKRDHNLPKRCFSDSRETIWRLRVDFLQERVLSRWENFTIWNAGKQGRKLYRCLSPTNQKKVRHRRDRKSEREECHLFFHRPLFPSGEGFLRRG